MDCKEEEVSSVPAKMEDLAISIKNPDYFAASNIPDHVDISKNITYFSLFPNDFIYLPSILAHAISTLFSSKAIWFYSKRVMQFRECQIHCDIHANPRRIAINENDTGAFRRNHSEMVMR